jgi:hypothetical protein
MIWEKLNHFINISINIFAEGDVHIRTHAEQAFSTNTESYCDEK